jgi:hypothetical protein
MDIKTFAYAFWFSIRPVASESYKNPYRFFIIIRNKSRELLDRYEHFIFSTYYHSQSKSHGH